MNAPLETPREEHVVFEFFLWSILLKGAISLAEVVVGIALFFIPPALIVSSSALIINHLPNPTLQQALLAEAAKYTEGAVVFVALYLLVRGLIKAVLIGGLLRNWLWTYPASLVVLGVFVLYQIYQVISEHSSLVVAITLFDLVVMYFIWREWSIVKRHAGKREDQPL